MSLIGRRMKKADGGAWREPPPGGSNSPKPRQNKGLISIMLLAQNCARFACRSAFPAKEAASLAAQRRYRASLRIGFLTSLAFGIAACSADLSLNNVTLVPKAEPLATTSDWSAGSNLDRRLTAADLVSAEGQCSETSVSAANAQNAPGSLGGISLRMSECDVIRRAGAVEGIELGANERGERSLVLTYLHGPWPGVYRFTNGRLVSIERAAAPPPGPETPQKKSKAAKKPAGS